MPVWKDADEVEVIGPRSMKLYIEFCTATQGSDPNAVEAYSSNLQ